MSNTTATAATSAAPSKEQVTARCKAALIIAINKAMEFDKSNHGESAGAAATITTTVGVANHVTNEALEEANKSVSEAIRCSLDLCEQGKIEWVVVAALIMKLFPTWNTHVALESDPDASALVVPAPAVERKPRRKRNARGLAPIDPVVVPTPPTVTIPSVLSSPTDPMSSMAAGILPHIQAVVQAHANKAAAEGLKLTNDALTKLTSAVNDRLLTIAAEALSATGGARGANQTVDENFIKEVLGKAMNNGLGEFINKSIVEHSEGAVRATLADIADKIKISSRSTNPGKEAANVKLHAIIEPVEDPTYMWSPDLEKLLKLLQVTTATGAQQNVLLVGPTGCGKTEFVQQLAAKLRRKFFIQDCANLREGREFFGIKGAAGGDTYFRPSQFSIAINTPGMVILLDEVNRVSDHVKNTLMPLLDARRKTFVEDLDATVEVAPGVIILASMNHGLEFTGTHPMDRALEDRMWRRVELSYLPAAKEIEVLMQRIDGLKKSDANRLVDAANVIRSKAASNQGGISRSISTRQLIAAASDFVVIGDQALIWCLANHFNGDGGADSERAQVIQTLEGKGFKFA